MRKLQILCFWKKHNEKNQKPSEILASPDQKNLNKEIYKMELHQCSVIDDVLIFTSKLKSLGEHLDDGLGDILVELATDIDKTINTLQP